MGERTKWKSFLEEYLAERDTVKVVFHLVDSRLDAVEAVDEEIMRTVRDMVASRPWRYVLVLTKADKLLRSAATEQVLDRHADNVRAKLVEVLGPDLAVSTPIVITSSVSKRGRDL